MAEQITNYKCPACTAPLRFDAKSGKLECDYCGSSFTLSEIETEYAGKNEQAEQAFTEAEQKPAEWNMDASGSEWGKEKAQLRVYNCPSCGAELICEETTAATSCPYCGNHTIIPGQLGNSRKPDVLIPFKVTKEEAVAALKRHYKGKPVLPKSFSDENHIQEIKGIYVPFWLFDADVDAAVNFAATRTFVHSTSKEVITETDHFVLYRKGTVSFEKVPVDGATKMPDELMDAIEPFDYAELKPFSLSYLPGFLADKYDVDKETSMHRADARCRNSALTTLRNTALGYETCTPIRENFDVRPGKVHYALLPVWLLTTQWNGKTYRFAMNGQTGRFIGDLPIDWKKMAMFCAGAFAAATAAFGWMFL